MEIPSIKVLDRDLKLLDEIDLYTSLDFVRQWQGIGSFSLIVCGGYQSLKKGNIIMLGSDGHRCGIIRSVECVNDDKGVIMTVTGHTLNGLTAQRNVLPYADHDEGGYFSVPKATAAQQYVSAEQIIKTYADFCFGQSADESRRFANIVIAENLDRGIETNWQSRYKQLDEELQSICEYCDCGYEIYIDLQSRKFVFEYLTGVDRSVSQNSNSRVIFSKEFESVTSIRYTEDNSNFKNVAYCGGAGDGADRSVPAVLPKDLSETPTGYDRFETFIDCGSLESVETATSISLEEEGQHRLEEYAQVRTLSADIAPYGSFRYRDHWDLGDMVTAADKQLNVTQDMRIVEVRESYEPEKYNISAVLGTLPKRLGRVIKSMQSPIK